MARKICPICNKDKDTSDMYYCPNDNMLFCKEHAYLGNYCPRCKKTKVKN